MEQNCACTMNVKKLANNAIVQVMREYVNKVDRLDEAENLRITEQKETEYKPVVLGEFMSIVKV